MMPDASSLHLDHGVDLEIFQCTGCGLVQTKGDPVPYYREVIRAAAYSPEMHDFRLRQFTEFIETNALKGKRLLEVGCGCGEYLSIFKQAGVEPFGIENAPASVEACRDNDLNVQPAFIETEEYVLDEAPFDVFAVLNFMEHWPDPNTTLLGIANNLRRGAIGLVEVPNFGMILQKSLFTEFISDHIFYFTQESLETTMRLNGFEVIECKSIWYDYILSATVRKREPVEVAQFTAQHSILQAEVDSFVAEHAGNVAIWGAGHQALATIALLDLSKGVRYIIDSALFKQGKYTPASHLPILSPKVLETDPVNAIVVMAASYSDEVVGVIREKHGDCFQLAVLRENHLELL